MDSKMYGIKKFSPWIAAAALVVASAGAQAASVTFSNFQDNTGSAWFDMSANVYTATSVDLGLNSFRADSGGPLSPSFATDAISFTITADPGYVITKVSYTESGTGKTENGIATATGSLVADGIPRNFLTQIFNVNTDSGWSITPSDVLIDNKQEIDVSITNALFAIALTGGDAAWIEKVGASLSVELAAIPLPPAVLMLGSALLGLATIGTRRRNS